MTQQVIAFIILAIVGMFIFVRNFANFISNKDKNDVKQERIEQLLNQTKIKKKNDITQIITKTTTPFLGRFPDFITKSYDKRKIEKNLKMSQWDKLMDVEQYIIINTLLKVFGLIVFLLLSQATIILAIMWTIPIVFIFPYAMESSATSRKERLYKQFPDFVRITQGYLIANTPLAIAVENTINYVGEDWKPILKDFLITTKTNNTKVALTEMADNIDIFEVKELISLIKINLEQGVDVKDSFNRQIEKVLAMQDFMLDKEIARRKTYAVVLQAPLFLTVLLAFSLPIIGQFMNSGI